MKKALIEFPDDLHRNLKRRAIDEDISLKELIVRAVREYIEHYPPVQPTIFDRLDDKKPQNE